MFKSNELKKARKNLIEEIGSCAWRAAKSEIGDPDTRDITISVIRYSATRYRELGGSVEKLIRKQRKRVEKKFEAVSLHHFIETGRLLGIDPRAKAREFIEDLVWIVTSSDIGSEHPEPEPPNQPDDTTIIRHDTAASTVHPEPLPSPLIYSGQTTAPIDSPSSATTAPIPYENTTLDASAIRRYALEVAQRASAVVPVEVHQRIENHGRQRPATPVGPATRGWLLGTVVTDGALDTHHYLDSWEEGTAFFLREDGELLGADYFQYLEVHDLLARAPYSLEPLTDDKMTYLDHPNRAGYHSVSSTRQELGKYFDLSVAAKGMGLIGAIQKLDERCAQTKQMTHADPRHPGRSPTATPPPSPHFRRRLAVIGAAVVGSLVVGALAATLIANRTQSTDSLRTDRPAEVTKCSTPPTFDATGFDVDAVGLLVSMRLLANCVDGDVLSSSTTRLTLSTGETNIASALFDLSQHPIAVSPPDSGSSTGITHTFRFPIGSFWRTPDTMPATAIVVEYEQIGAESAITATTGADTVPSDAIRAAAPAFGDAELASLDALHAIADSDRMAVQDQLSDRWIPQLSSKRPGLIADGITWNNDATLSEHLRLRAQYPDVRLLWSGDWSTFSASDFWVTVAGVVYADPDAAVGWCQSQMLDRDHCYGKLVSTTHPIEGSTRFQPG